MTVGFLSPIAVTHSDGRRPIARGPMERMARAAGGRFEVRDGWNVAVDYASQPTETGWADMSHLTKLELQGDGAARGSGIAGGSGNTGELGTATRTGDAWFCPLTAQRALIIGETEDVPAGALDVTTCFAALTIFGTRARETIARFCAIDLRPQISPPGSFRPGSIARQPGMIVCEAPDRYLLLFGWALGEYMWTVVEDAARRLGGGPVGADALRKHTEVAARA